MKVETITAMGKMMENDVSLYLLQVCVKSDRGLVAVLRVKRNSMGQVQLTASLYYSDREISWTISPLTAVSLQFSVGDQPGGPPPLPHPHHPGQ